MPQKRFDQLETVAPAVLADFLKGQMPLLAAVVLNHLSPAHTAKVLANLPASLQHDIVSNMGKARQTPPEVLDSLEDGLMKKADGLIGNSPRANPAAASGYPAPAFGEMNQKQEDDPLSQYAWKPRSVSGVKPVNQEPPQQPVNRSVLDNHNGQPQQQPQDYSSAKPAFTDAPRYSDSGSVRKPATHGYGHAASGATNPDPVTNQGRGHMPLSNTPAGHTAFSQATQGSASFRPSSPFPSAHQAAFKAGRSGGKGGADKKTALRNILEQLRAQSGKPPAGKSHRVDGMALAAEILRYAPTSVRHNVRDAEPQLYERLHGRMFVFEDLGTAPQQALGVVFSEFDLSQCALALRFASERLQERALSAVSPRRAQLLRDEMQQDAGRVRISEVETAQQEAIEFAMNLQSEGRILIDATDPDLA